VVTVVDTGIGGFANIRRLLNHDRTARSLFSIHNELVYMTGRLRRAKGYITKSSVPKRCRVYKIEAVLMLILILPSSAVSGLSSRRSGKSSCFLRSSMFCLLANGYAVRKAAAIWVKGIVTWYGNQGK
jgi:hypothetical protein